MNRQRLFVAGLIAGRLVIWAIILTAATAAFIAAMSLGRGKMFTPPLVPAARAFFLLNLFVAGGVTLWRFPVRRYPILLSLCGTSVAACVFCYVAGLDFGAYLFGLLSASVFGYWRKFHPIRPAVQAPRSHA